MTTAWHDLVYVLGISPGSYWTAFWSGFGSGPLAWCVLPLGYWLHHICHEDGCYRWGHPHEGVVKCKQHVKAQNRAQDDATPPAV